MVGIGRLWGRRGEKFFALTFFALMFFAPTLWRLLPVTGDAFKTNGGDAVDGIDGAIADDYGFF